MDIERKVSKRKQWQKKFGWTLTIPLLAIVAFGLHFSMKDSKVKIELETIILSEVQQRNFREQITCDGLALPYRSVMIEIPLGGKVLHRHALNGEHLKRGNLILELQNTDLELDILNKETQVYELINNIQFTATQQEQNRVNRLSELADANYQLKEQKRLFKMNKSLYEEEVIPHSNWMEIVNKLAYFEQKTTLIQQAVINDSLSNRARLKQMESSLGQTRKNLSLMKNKLADLMVLAPITGQLSAFKVEEGELIGVGEKIGQIDVLDSFIIRAQVDEHFLDRIALNQTASIELNSSVYQLQVQYINPSVENNFFSIDLVFMASNQPKLKRGQNIRAKLHLGDERESLTIEKGSFYQSTGGQWAYVLNEEGYAVKRSLKIGRQNEKYYEVIEGLSKGEQVIISSYSKFKDYDKLELI